MRTMTGLERRFTKEHEWLEVTGDKICKKSQLTKLLGSDLLNA